MTIKVVTYNVLSENYGTSSCFNVDDPKSLDVVVRHNKILSILRDYMMKEYIVCLQEVTIAFRSKIIPLLSPYKYTFNCLNYGNKHSGNMGVMLLIPSKQYRVVSTTNYHVADYISCVARNQNVSCIDTVKRLFSHWTGTEKKKTSAYNNMFRKNHVLMFVLKDMVDREFVIATYHMPCVFYDPAVMLVHVHTLLELVEKYSNDLPYIVTGDFNFFPDTEMYKLVTGESFSDDVITKNFPIGTTKKLYNFNLDDCYYSYNKNHKITTSCDNARYNMKFSGCIDYIFAKKNCFKVLNAEVVKYGDGKYYPDLQNPSDHLPVECSLRLK